jgi:hypothetical protein
MAYSSSPEVTLAEYVLSDISAHYMLLDVIYDGTLFTMCNKDYSLSDPAREVCCASFSITLHKHRCKQK